MVLVELVVMDQDIQDHLNKVSLVELTLVDQVVQVVVDLLL